MTTTKHDKEKFVALALLRNDPVLFVTKVLKRKPRKWQIKFMKAVADNRQIAVRSAQGVGKSKAVAWLILWGLCTHFPIKMALTSVTMENISNSTWAELRTEFGRLPDEFREKFDITSERIYMKGRQGESFCTAITASKDSPTSFQGIHCFNAWIFCDEASGIDDQIFEYLQGTMGNPNAKLVMTGNPNYSTGFFYNAFNKNANLFTTMKVSRADILEDNDESCSKEATEALLQGLRQTYGENSNAYRVRALGEFPEADDDTVMPRTWVEAATERFDLFISDEIDLITPIVWGLDVARFGDDRTALAKRQGNRLLSIEHWGNRTLTETAGRVANLYKETPPHEQPTRIYIDTVGIGAGVYDRLQEQGYPVEAVNVSESPAIKERFVRLRDELWWKGREWFEARSCFIPSDEELITELSAPRYTFESTGKIKVESKNDLKRRGQRSPDLADAFLLTLVWGNDASQATGDLFRKPLKYNVEFTLV